MIFQFRDIIKMLQCFNWILFHTVQSGISLIFKIFMSQDRTRVRKCLSAMRVERQGKLVANNQRKSYFICLKMLDILPPPPKSDFASWKFYTPARLTNKQSILYTPKCLHDVLISSHATSCQHNTLFFGYYHRHVMIILEVFLNLAHQILRGGEKALNAVYPNNGELYNESNKELWAKVFREYQEFTDVPNEISAHYWNPTDFKSDENLYTPEQLDWDRTGKSLDNIDNLSFSINNCYPWEINVARRWYDKKEDYEKDMSDGFTNSQIFKNYFDGNQYSTQYSQKQLKFLNGKLNPHYNSSELSIKDISHNPNPRLLFDGEQGFLQKTWRITAQQSYRLFLKDRATLRLCPIKKDQSLLSYGAESKQAHYISISDRTHSKKNITIQYRKDYNDLLPHVNYASSLSPSLKFKNFLVSSGFERSHGIMHNNFGAILNNSVFSITSLIFFPYHSWIDAELQFKIREANTRGEYNDIKVTLTKLYRKQSSNLQGVLKEMFTNLGNGPNQAMKNVSQFGLSGFPVNSQNVGYYPIFEWITPPFLNSSFSQLVIKDISNISAAFLSQDYIVTDKQKIRDSTTLDDAYQKYFQLYQSRYSFFENLKQINPAFKFSANHNYQIGSSPKDIDNILAYDASNIPQYLKEVLQDFLTIDKAHKKANQILIPRRLKAVGSPKQVQAAFIETDPTSDQQAEEEQRLQLKKVLQSSIQLFASYPVDSPNQTHQIVVRPHNIIELLKEIIKKNLKVSEAEFSELQSYIKDGVSIDSIQIFGKANFADICPRCKECKNIYRNLGESLRNSSPRLWKYLHIKTLNKVLFDSNNHQPLNCIYQKLQLIPNPTFTDYRFVRGAEEIHINIINQAGKSEKFVRIDAESYSVQKNSLQSVLSKKYKNFKTSFDFFKIFDVNQEKDSNYFDHYIYKHIKGTFIVNQVVADFSFQIPTFQRLLRLDITVSTERNEHGKVSKVNLKVEDRDYEIKVKFYEISQELLTDILENSQGIDFQQ